MNEYKKESLEAVNGKPLRTFIKFTFPNLIGFIAMSSASIVDGIFVGKFVSNEALGSINIVTPIFTFVIGVAIMLSIGSAVIVGKYLGEGNYKYASDTFTKVIILIVSIALLMTLLCNVFAYRAALLLGANAEIAGNSSAYLRILSVFFLFQTLQYAFALFIRLDGNPYLSSVAIIAGALINFGLDYLFIVQSSMGVKGAALATGISFTSAVVILSFHFILKKGHLRFKIVSNKWHKMLKAIYNGASELLSEASTGTVVLIFNWIMITKIGTKGVEAFTVISYTILVSNTLCYGIGDALIPLLSINYGAKKPERLRKFVTFALIFVALIGLSIFTLLSLIPEKLVGMFLNSGNTKAYETALEFAHYVRWGFLVSGSTIILSAYHTSIQKPLESLLISLLRGLAFPITYLFFLYSLTGMQGVYSAIAFAEATTFIIAIMLFRRNLPSKRVASISNV